MPADIFDTAMTIFMLRPSTANFDSQRGEVALALRQHSKRIR